MGKNKAGWGGKRTGSGRKRARVRKATVKKQSSLRVVDPALSDSLTAAMGNWMLAVMGSEEQRLTYFHFVTLYCFGHLRQSNAIKLLTPDCAGYLGFSVLSSPAQLAEFIAAQDKIQWTEQVTQELSKLPGKNSFKAAVGTASVYELLGDDEWWRHLNEATSYQDAWKKLQTLPSNRRFVSKNVLTVVLNGIVFPQVSRAKLPLWLCVVLDDFLVNRPLFLDQALQRYPNVFLAMIGS